MSENSNPKQCQRVLDYMRKHGSITQFEASVHLSVQRLPSRIFEIRNQGYTVKSERVTVINQFGEKCRPARYWLEDEKQ